jgi:hypothetical protein
MIKESDPKVTFSAVSVLDDIDLSLLTKHLLPLEDVTEEVGKSLYYKRSVLVV